MLRFILLIATGVCLWRPMAFAYYNGPEAKDAVQFYEFTLRSNRAPYREAHHGRANQYWQAMVRYWDVPEVKEFVKRGLEPLSRIKNCSYCDLTLSAYLGGSPELKQRAIELGRKLFLEYEQPPNPNHNNNRNNNEKTEQQREQERQNNFNNKLNTQFNQAYNRRHDEEPRPFPVEEVGAYWGELKLPVKWYRQTMQHYLTNPHNQHNKVRRELVDIIFTSLLGADGYAKWWQQERESLLREVMEPLTAYANNTEPPKDEHHDDDWNQVRNHWHQARVVLFEHGKDLPGEILFKAYRKASLSPQSRHDDMVMQLLHLILVSGDQGVIDQLKELMARRLAGEDPEYQAFMEESFKDGRHQDHYHEWFREEDHDDGTYFKYPSNLFHEWRQNRVMDPKTERGRKNLFVDKMLLSLARFRQEMNETVDAKGLAEIYGLKYEDFLIYLRHFSRNPEGRMYQFSKNLILDFRGEEAWQELQASYQDRRLERAVEFLRAIPVAERIHQRFSPVNAYLYNIFLKVNEPQVQELLIEKWEILTTDQNLRGYLQWYLLIAAQAKSRTIIDLALDLLRKQFSGEDAHGNNRWGNESTPAEERFRNLIHNCSEFFSYEMRMPEGLDGLAQLLIHLPAVNEEPVREMLRKMAVEHDRSPVSNLARKMLHILEGEAEYVAKIESRQGRRESRSKRWFQNLEGTINQFRNLYESELNGNLNYSQVKNLWNQMENLQAEMFAEPVKAYVRENLTRTTLSRENALAGSLWYLALGSRDPELFETAVRVMRYRVEGNDPFFNSTWAIEAKTASKRFRVIFDQLLFSIPIDKWTSDVELTVVKAVLGMGVGYESMQDYLERVYREYNQPVFKRIAQRIIVELKGLEYLEQLADLTDRKKFLYVNGGYDRLSNYSVNEEDLKAWHYNLFHSKTIVLNAGGPGGTVVPINGGHAMRDEKGLIKLQPGLELEKPYLAATEKNLRKTLQEIKETKPLSLTAVYGDHGGPQSLAMWNGDYLTASMLQKMYREYPEEVQIRSVFLQCYAASLIASPERRVPPFVSGLKPYIKRHYPKNRCSYANGHHDELGTYYSWGSKWEDSNWSQLFKMKGNLTLQGLKDFMLTENRVDSSPVLSSDYFIKDFTKTFCKEAEYFAKIEAKHGPHPESWPTEKKKKVRHLVFHKLDTMARARAVETLCNNPREKQRKQVVEDYINTVQLLYNDIRSKDNQLRREVIKDSNPEVYKKYEEGNRLRGEIISKYSNKGTDLEGMSEEDKERLKEIQNDFIFPYQHLVKSFDHMKDHDKILNKKAIEYFTTNKQKYGKYVQDNFLKENHHRRVIDEVKSQVRNEMNRKQTERKGIEKEIYKERLAGLKAILNEPTLEFVRETYENLVECEGAFIN